MNKRELQLATYYAFCVNDLRLIIKSVGYDEPVEKFKIINLANCINSWVTKKHVHIIEDILAEQRNGAN